MYFLTTGWISFVGIGLCRLSFYSLMTFGILCFSRNLFISLRWKFSGIKLFIVFPHSFNMCRIFNDVIFIILTVEVHIFSLFFLISLSGVLSSQEITELQFCWPFQRAKFWFWGIFLYCFSVLLHWLPFSSYFLLFIWGFICSTLFSFLRWKLKSFLSFPSIFPFCLWLLFLSTLIWIFGAMNSLLCTILAVSHKLW